MDWLVQKLLYDSLFARMLLCLSLLFGGLTYNSVIRENYPDLDIPKTVIRVFWSGASPDQIEKEITNPIEDQIRSIKGLKTFNSGSYSSYSVITAEFDADMSVTDALQLLRDKVSKAESEFPPDDNIGKPEIEEVSVSNMPVISLIMHGNIDDLILSDVAKSTQTQLERLSVVKRVRLGGLREKSVHIQLKPHKLRELGISPILVRDRLQSANRDIAWGEFEGSETTLSLYLEGRFDRIEKIKDLTILRMGNNRVVKLNEIANINLRLDREISRTYFSLGEYTPTKGITLDIIKRPGEDTFKVVEEVERLVSKITSNSEWPHGLSIENVTDDAELIELAFGEVAESMQQSVIIIFCVLILLLTWREAIVAGIAIPITLLSTFTVTSLMGYTLSSMILVGMVWSLGLLVDVFILVMEGMHENIHVRKKSFESAALSTVKTFLLPATAGQLTTVLAMVPLIMMGGISGKFIRILPLTVTITLIISLIVAFFICIPLSRVLLKNEKHDGKELFINRLSIKYRQSLAKWLMKSVVKNRVIALFWVVCAFGLFTISLFAVMQLPTMMFSESDDRKVGITIQLGPDATLGQAQEVANKAGDFIRKQPWIEKAIHYVGEKSPITTGALTEVLLPDKAYSLVGFTLILLPKKYREKLSFEYLNDIRSGLKEALKDEPALEIFLTHIGGNPYNAAPIQIQLIGDDYKKLREISSSVRQQLKVMQGVKGVRDNLGAPHRELRFQFLPERMSFHGLSEQSVGQQIRMAMQQDGFGQMKMMGVQEEPEIRLSMEWPSRSGELGSPKHISEMRLMQVITDEGRSVPLLDLAQFQLVEAPQVILHNNGRRAITIQARAEGVTATSVMNAISPYLEELKDSWPKGYEYRLSGEKDSTSESYSNMTTAMTLAIGSIFVLLALVFNNIRQPLIILLIVPLSLTGTFFGFFFTEIPISFVALMGVVSLAGIAVNDGIIIIETMNNYRKNGFSISESAARGSADRLRPVLSTSLTTILGLIPLAISDPKWYPLCMAVIYGLIAATVFAMIIVPALYVLLTSKNSTVVG